MRSEFTIEDGVAKIPLRKRGGIICAYALVDIEDAERLCRHRWYQHHNRGYAARSIRTVADGRKTHHVVFMHREVLGLPQQKYRPTFVVDHINQNKLDNRRCNLREATHRESVLNRDVYVVGVCGACGGSGVVRKRADLTSRKPDTMAATE